MGEIEKKIRKIIEEALSRSKVNLKEIILFGSRAREEFGEESDYDILVVIGNGVTFEKRREIWKDVFRSLHREFPFVPFDLIIKSVKDFEEEKEVANTISSEAFIEGIKI